MYGLMSFHLGFRSINVGGYKIEVEKDYDSRIEQIYRPQTVDSQYNTIPHNYGTHVKTANAEWKGSGPEPDSIFYSGTNAKLIHDIIILNNLIAQEQAILEAR